MKLCEKLCVFFLSTTQELDEGSLKSAIDCYLTNIKTNSKFDLFIFLDKSPSTYDFEYLIGLENKYTCIQKINVVSNDIKNDKNIYIKKVVANFDIEKYQLGRSHGINYHFFKTMKYLFNTKYENFLLLESDTKPLSDNWYLTCKEYCDHDFSIAGSLYKGVNKKQVYKNYWGKHLNGVALYKNTKKTQELINNSEQYLINELKQDRLNTNDKIHKCFMNYDVAIYLCAKQTKTLNLYKDTDFITNISCGVNNAKISENEILTQYPHTQILHRKKLYKKNIVTNSTKIKYFFYGNNKKLSMFSYESYKDELSSIFTEVTCPYNNKVDVVFVSYIGDILDNFKRFYIFSKKVDAKIILLSEEPLFDNEGSDRILYKKGKTYIKNSRGNRRIRIHILNYFTTDIFEFDKIPYFLTTNTKYIEHYKSELIKLDASYDNWINKKYDFASLHLKRKSNYDKVQLKNLENGKLLGDLREQLMILLTDSNEFTTKFIGHGYELEHKLTDTTIETNRDDANWHIKKLNWCKQNSKFLLSIENTICKNYITEKIFDSIASYSIPIFYLKDDQKIKFEGINLYKYKHENFEECKRDLIRDILLIKNNPTSMLNRNLNNLIELISCADYQVKYEISNRVKKLKYNVMNIIKN